MFELIILGSGTCSISKDRNPAGYCLRHENNFYLIDTGPGIARQLVKAGVPLQKIDAIFYTHYHIDHFIDLPFILFSMKYDPQYKRNEQVKIFGGQGLYHYVEGLRKIFDSWIYHPEEMVLFYELKPYETIKLNSLTISTSPIIHTESSVSYSFKDERGKKIVFSGDTTYCEEIIKISENADILVLECSYSEDITYGNHLRPSEAGLIAQKANVKRLILTHFYPQAESSDLLSHCKKYYNGDIVLAEDFARFIL